MINSIRYLMYMVRKGDSYVRKRDNELQKIIDDSTNIVFFGGAGVLPKAVF